MIDMNSFDQITRQKRVPPDLIKKHPLLIEPLKVIWSVDIEHSVVQRGNAYCPAPSKVVIHVGYRPRAAIMLKEAATIPCLRKSLTAHHYKHIEAADAALQTLLPDTRDAMGEALTKAKQTPAQTEEEAEAAFEAAVHRTMEWLTLSLQEKAAKLEAEIDRPEELDKIKSCGSAEPREGDIL